MADPSDTVSQAEVIPVIEEQLKVSRRTVETGAVRVRKRVEEVSGQLDDPLIFEHVDTKRVPIGRVIEEPVSTRQEGDVTIIPVVEERLVLRKELVLVEEIHLTRRREERPANQPVTLRRERASVERLNPETQEWLSEDEG